ncbi:MAG TPA: ABC transporter permease subunit [Anaerolineales bacterium]|nr:ABC transporter permease subunit [Anaerolineales bacterium]
MSTLSMQKIAGKGDSPSAVISSMLLRLGVVLVFDVFIIYVIANLIRLGYYTLSIPVIAVAIFVNVVLLIARLAPIRWMAIGISFMILFTIYPIFFTVWVAFTNYGDGHLLSKEVAITQILSQKFLPEAGKAYTWTAYRNDLGDYVLYLVDTTDGSVFLAREGETLTESAPGVEGVGELDANGIPIEIEGYTRLNVLAAAADPNLPEILFGDPENTIQIRSPSEAAELISLYEYDPELDAMVSNADGTVYRNLDGTFTSQTGRTVIPGFVATIGWTNFTNFFSSPALRGPLIRIIGWNFAFAILTVLTSFGLGLAIAIFFNDPDFPFKKLIRSLLLVPYTIPALITILIWRGMMNPELGVINRTLQNLIGFSPPWFTDQWWAKIAILIVNLWLSYPYFMLICSGALQSIPTELYQAAEVDGASPWQRFRRITLPLLLVAVGPLLIASFTFNFNNFNLIYLFIGGGPPIAGASTTAGHTDILISYVYNLAFSGGRGVNYGFASAITIIIFLVVGAITLYQFRYTNMWEEVSENV